MVHWTQNSCEPLLRHSKSGREDGKGKEARRLVRYRFPSLPVTRLVASTRVFVAVNEAPRYLATKVKESMRGMAACTVFMRQTGSKEIHSVLK